MKERENSPEELDEVEARNLSEREFKVMIIRKLKHEKRHRNHKKGPVRNREGTI